MSPSHAVTPDAKTIDRARHPTVWGRTIGAMLRCASAVGLDPDALRRELHLEARSLVDADARVPLDALFTLLELCMERTGDELAPLSMARAFDVESMDALGLLAVSSADLGEALDVTIRYQRVFAEGERYAIERLGAAVHVRYEPWGPSRPAHVAMADMFARDLAVNMQALVGAPIEGARVRLRRRRAADPERYVALLGIEPELGAPLDEVVLPEAALATPIPRADPMMARFFARFLDARIANLPPESTVARAATVVQRQLAGGPPDLADAARAMRLSARTLQRRLADEGTSFAELVEETRRARALAMVEAGASLAEIAWSLGYSQPSAFHRAFRRWTGTTPAAWRTRAR